MKIHLRVAIAILAMAAAPTFAETTAPQVVTPSTQSSGAGVQGKAGGKSGPAVGRDGTDQANPATRPQDTSGLQGKPGGKSGPAVSPPR
jgi:hypothetical protein